MESDLIHINEWLRPLSWLYGAAVWLRGLLFDQGLLQQTRFGRMVVCVGNITVGGTGKTPHTEWLLAHLLPHYRVAMLSRGYRRQSRGFHIAEADTPMSVVGDEPWQMKHKFPDAIVAVDANRRRGIRTLLSMPQTSDVDIIVLDDAYQHRYVKPDLNLLLTDYHRLVTDDCLLPAGRLREPVSAMNRAHAVIVTKCPATLSPMDYRVLTESLRLKPYQRLFFTTLTYGRLRPLFAETPGQDEELTPQTHVLLLTGIASPRQMLADMQRQTRHIRPLTFADHHPFSARDIERIEEAFTAMQGSKRLIVTTEKDAARLSQVHTMSTIVRRHIYVLPVGVTFLRHQEGEFLAMLHQAISEKGTRA